MGYYTFGGPGVKYTQLLCPFGQYCTGSGVPLDCPIGSYGGSLGLTSSLCSGRCNDGVLCPLRSLSPEGEPCPQGHYCRSGVAEACPSGTFNPLLGAFKSSACTPCPANTYGARSGSTSLTACVPCDVFEGSDPAAIACWPGVRGWWQAAQWRAERRCFEGPAASSRRLPRQ